MKAYQAFSSPDGGEGRVNCNLFLEFGRFSREFKRINGPCPSKQTFRSTQDGNVNEASVSLQAGNESLRLVATIAAYFAAIVGLCGRIPELPTIKRNLRV